jgi:hypothetical protein
MEAFQPVVTNINESLGLVRYALLWGTGSIGLASLALVRWSDDASREAIREASARTRSAPGAHALLGLAATLVVVVPVVALVRGAPVLGLAAVAALAVYAVAPALAAAALVVGDALDRLAGRQEGGSGSVVIGLGVMTGTGFLFLVGLLPWCWWMLGGIGGIVNRRLGAWTTRAIGALATRAASTQAPSPSPAPGNESAPPPPATPVDAPVGRPSCP